MKLLKVFVVHSTLSSTFLLQNACDSCTFNPNQHECLYPDESEEEVDDDNDSGSSAHDEPAEPGEFCAAVKSAEESCTNLEPGENGVVVAGPMTDSFSSPLVGSVEDLAGAIFDLVALDVHSTNRFQPAAAKQCQEYYETLSGGGSIRASIRFSQVSGGAYLREEVFLQGDTTVREARVVHGSPEGRIMPIEECQWCDYERKPEGLGGAGGEGSGSQSFEETTSFSEYRNSLGQLVLDRLYYQSLVVGEEIDAFVIVDVLSVEPPLPGGEATVINCEEARYYRRR